MLSRATREGNASRAPVKCGPPCPSNGKYAPKSSKKYTPFTIYTRLRYASALQIAPIAAFPRHQRHATPAPSSAIASHPKRSLHRGATRRRASEKMSTTLQRR